MVVTQKDLDAVLAANPNLSASGFVDAMEGENPVDLGQMDLACRWLDHHGRRVSVNPDYSSYGLKHHVEAVASALRPGAIRYVSNGAFIAAALHLGYRVVRLRNGPNARINISFKTGVQAELRTKAAAGRNAQCPT